jgi:glutaryl-CoA dehydrogenase
LYHPKEQRRRRVQRLLELFGEGLRHRRGRSKEQGNVRPERISMAKMDHVSTALDIARQARDILSADGVIDEYPVIPHMLNLETVNSYEGTADVHRLIIGKDITGYDAFS